MSISTLTSNISANVLADLTVDGAGRHQITSERFDFGSGPVPAARHRNPDGSVGGWVAVSAHVDSAAWVGPDAVVFGNARVLGRSVLEDRAVVAELALVRAGAHLRDEAVVVGAAVVDASRIEDQAVVTDDSIVSGGAVVGDLAIIGGNARVSGDVVVVGNAKVGGNVWLTKGTIVLGDAELKGREIVRNHTITRSTGRPAVTIGAMTPPATPRRHNVVATEATIDDQLDRAVRALTQGLPRRTRRS